MNAVTIGPLAFEATRFAAILGIAALFLAASLADWLARRCGTDGGIAEAVWPVLLSWAVGARLGWVVMHWADYAAHPGDILRFWQGGFSLGWGFAAAGIAVGWKIRRRPGRALSLAMVCIMAVTVGGLALLVGNAPGRIALPDAALQDMAGRPVSLIAPDGPLVVNLWASWCPPCRRELPMMVEQAQLPGAPRFVFANQGETAVQVQAFLTRVGIGPDHIALDSTAGMMTAFDAAGLPLTLIFDERGEMVSSHVGEISRAELLRQIAKISGVKR